MKGLVIAGTQSGVGKTTVAMGIMGALRSRGLRVAPFKAGPDYIDPTYHAAAADQPSRNLDTWMLPPSVLLESYSRAAARADVAVIEGVMGLFDGRSGEDEVGSTAHLAKLLSLPVVLVVDAAAMARSAAAMVLGYRQFDPELKLCGVILNNLGSAAHYNAARSAIERQAGVPVLGGLFRDPTLALPDRHLGLVPAAEHQSATVLAAAREAVERYTDVGAILTLAAEGENAPTAGDQEPILPLGRVPLAIARDEAFSFYYEDGLDILRAAGADLLPFSPLRDPALPAGCRGVYIGGGFPELYAEQLSANLRLHEDLQKAARRGLPIYAECGGHMYLGRELTDAEGRTHRMACVTPTVSSLAGTRLTLGYRVARACRSGPLFRLGDTVRAHEFHLSTAAPAEPSTACWEIVEPPLGPSGYAQDSVWSSYLHLHFGAAPEAACRFLETCGDTVEPWTFRQN